MNCIRMTLKNSPLCKSFPSLMIIADKQEQEWAKGRDNRMGNWVSFNGKRKRTVGDGGDGPTVMSDSMRFGGSKPGNTGASGGSGAVPEKDYKKRWR